MGDFNILIAISGRARAGKDTFADFLLEEFKGYEMTKVAYADELKRRLMEDFDLSWEQVYGDLKEVPDERFLKPIRPYCAGLGKDKLDSPYWTPREIMQFIGTDCYRRIDGNFWVKQLFKTLSKDNKINAIISDCRFRSEVDAVLERGGHHVRIYRRDADKIHNSNHASETSLDDYENVDFSINNYGTLEDLRVKAKIVANTIKEDF